MDALAGNASGAMLLTNTPLLSACTALDPCGKYCAFIWKVPSLMTIQQLKKMGFVHERAPVILHSRSKTCYTSAEHAVQTVHKHTSEWVCVRLHNALFTNTHFRFHSSIIRLLLIFLHLFLPSIPRSQHPLKPKGFSTYWPSYPTRKALECVDLKLSCYRGFIAAT